MAAEGIAGYLRYRVVNRSSLFCLKDGFELDGTPEPKTTLNYNQPASNTLSPQYWKSIGTDPGTDNSITYWNQLAGVFTYAGHVLTVPATVGAQIIGGHQDWTDGTFRCRFRWLTGAQARPIVHCDGTINNFIFAAINGATLRLFKHVAGVDTQIGAAPAAVLTNNVNYWCEIVCIGTSYQVALYNDSTGVIGSTIATLAFQTIADAGVQSGYIGFQNPLAVSYSVGGANNGVCIFYGSMPDGTQGQRWTPVVTAGEPAFAWSKTGPFAGTYHLSITSLNAAGSGAWQQKIRLLPGARSTVSIQAKASAGTANVTAGALTTPNAGTTYALISVVGAITKNPTVSLNYSGAAGTAYFDELLITNMDYEITNDLPHIHQSEWKVVGMQPHNPSNSGLGSFKIPLHPPRSDQFKDALPVYLQLREYLRVEAYSGLSPIGIGTGKLVFAGFITGMVKSKTESGGTWELIGIPDIVIGNLSFTFPGEQLSLTYGTGLLPAPNSSLRQVRNYLGVNEPGWYDDFTAYDANNYNSVASPVGGVGTWVADTDNGLPVVKCNVGTGGALLAKMGIKPGDANRTAYVEIRGRLKPNTQNATNSGKFGLGLSLSGIDFVTEYAQTGYYALAYCTSKWNATTGRYDLDLNIQTGGPATTVSNFLTGVDDPEGYIPFEMTLLIADYDVSNGTDGKFIVTVNGQVKVANLLGTQTMGQATLFPYLFYGNSATSSGPPAYFNSIYQFARYTDDGYAASTFKLGGAYTPTRSIRNRSDAGPTFLDMWTRVAAMENVYWRYTPQAYRPELTGRTLGTVDFLAEPGTDLSNSCIFSFERGNVKEFTLTANDDAVASATSISSVAGNDGGGIASWRDISALEAYGAISDQTLFITAASFAEQFPAARQMINNKVLIGRNGAKIASLVRDGDTVDRWRELDKIGLDDKDLDIANLSARVLSYTFREGDMDQTVELDQFSIHNARVPQKRVQQAIYQMTREFAKR